MTIIAPGGPRAPEPTTAAVPAAPTSGGRASPAGRRAETRPDRSTTVGIVFVHGIGSQRPGETLLDWSRPLIRLLTEWRIAHDLPPDPMVASDIDFTGATLPSIELAIPAGPVGSEAEACAAHTRTTMTAASTPLIGSLPPVAGARRRPRLS